MQKFRQLDEALDWIVQGPTSQEKIKRFKFVVEDRKSTRLNSSH